VKNYTYHFEIKDLVTQFINAFDNIIIKRYDQVRSAKSNIQVRYVYSPKQRVMYDLVNRAQNLTVPVVAVSISNVARDENRVFNKIGGFYFSQGTSSGTESTKSDFYKSPVPVNITINMSILTKFQTDMDQILSNFIPYNNPYIIISWKVPEAMVEDGFTVPQEIRSEVLWNGNIALSYPTDINASEKYRIIGDTSFTIKGWLFGDPSFPADNIFYVNSNFYNASSLLDTTFETLSSQTFTYPVSSGLSNDLETVSISAFPQLTNIDYTFQIL
jgi:hypothetical protein